MCQRASVYHPKFSIAILFVIFVNGSILLKTEAFSVEPRDAYLKKVFIVFRHGDRTPTEAYPNDPNINYTWPGGWGTLTKKGMKQMYDLGEWLRVKYGALTDNKYVAASTMVNSSFSDRCLESTQAFLAGFFKQNDQEAFVKGLPWRPIPVHYLPREIDQILTEKTVCPRLKLALDDAYRNESQKSDAQLESYYSDLSRITGQDIKTVSDVEDIYDTLEIEFRNGLQLQEEIKPYFNEQMRELATRNRILLTSNDLQLRLRGGPLLKEILDRMNNDKGKEKIFVYATHDRNIISSLRAMGFTKENYEFYKLEFGATLVFELRSVDGGDSQEVKISMMKSADSRSLVDLKIPGCEEFCKLDDLAVIWKNVLPVDWKNECKL